MDALELNRETAGRNTSSPRGDGKAHFSPTLGRKESPLMDSRSELEVHDGIDSSLKRSPKEDVRVINPFDPGYYSEIDLRNAGFKSLGRNIKIAKNCTIVGLQNIEIGNHVRIDGYTSLIVSGSGWLKIGSYVHIGGSCHLSCGAGIQLEDFCGLSQGVRIYSKSDDYSGNHLTNPTVPERFKGVSNGPVTLGRHVIVGSGSVILPKVSIGEGSSVGALSLVAKSLDCWGVYFGAPATRLKSRSKRLLELEAQLIEDGNL